MGVPAELSSLVEQLYHRTRAQYGDGAGQVSLARLYEDLSGINLRLNDSTPSSLADVVAAEVPATASIAASVAASVAVASSVNSDQASA
ncbi:hypothetical protein [Cryobacterium sp. Y50]|uniref:hypothetical protein n=1 Tax=Cryobacterium sp. Y50 TaxID=2048286 RepID=UPI000CE45216|nr:hypothetical protein [Cryobacterium sp. Y50]